MTERQPTATFPPQAADPVADSTPLGTGPTPTAGFSGLLPAHAEEFLPRPFGRYELRRLLGAGGMGHVYLAHDPQLDRFVALKMPNPVAVAGWRERFFAEARAAATLTHPNVCPVYEVGEADGQPYLTMAYIEGETLAAKLVRDGRASPRAAVELVCTVARAIQEAHRRGIVHRDLKPANLMIDPGGRPVIMDFGLALRATAADDLRLTLTGVALGTPAYMPPEQAGGDHGEIGPPADVYALGVILYELVAGRVPFKGKSFGKLLAQIERDVPPPPSSFNPAVDPALEAVILKCLAKRASERFDTAGDLADALQRYLEGDRNGLISLYSTPYAIPETTAELSAAEPATTVAYARPPRRGWLLAAGAAALLALVVLAGAVIYVQTDYGDLKVELSDPNAKVKVRVNGQEVILDDGGKVYRVKAGPGEVVVSGDGFETAARSFNLKRDATDTVTITLIPKPRPGPPVKPGDPKAKEKPSEPEPPVPAGVAVAPMPRDAKPKPVPFPEKSTLIEVAGWQILADATKEEMEKWLKQRKDAKHSVMWLDCYQVGDKPVFAGAAALDDLVADWVPLLDMTGAEANDVNLLGKRIQMQRYYIASMSGYLQGSELRGAALFHRGFRFGKSMGIAPQMTYTENLEKHIQTGLVTRVLRPFPLSDGQIWCAVYMELVGKQLTLQGFDLTEVELDQLIAQQQKDGNRLESLSAVEREGRVRFAATFKENKTKATSGFQHGLTAANLKTKADEQVKRGFQPTCVTAYAHDGAVRYCAVWVKEPSRPVPYPKAPTLIEVEGWQIYANATKDQMKEWLDKRKADKHSVTWLDVTQVEGKPLFSAVAALDRREPGWKAFLNTPLSATIGIGAIKKLLDTEAYWLTAISGYVAQDEARVCMLWLPGNRLWSLNGGAAKKVFDEQTRLGAENGYSARIVRPYTDDLGVILWAANLERGLNYTTEMDLTLAAPEITEHFEKSRKANRIPLSVSGYFAEKELTFAVVTGPNKTKLEWEAVVGLRASELKTKAEELAKKGYRPGNVTAYPFDGAVRYCVVWVKEPPKEKKP